MIKAVLTSPDRDFTLPAEIHVSARGFFAVATRGAEPRLFAAVASRMITGALTPFLADVLLREEDAMRVAERHGVSAAVAEAALAKLRALGLSDLHQDAKLKERGIAYDASHGDAQARQWGRVHRREGCP
jgi:hypothetical protein